MANISNTIVIGSNKINHTHRTYETVDNKESLSALASVDTHCLNSLNVREVRNYQSRPESKMHLVLVEDEISATFELLKIVRQFNQDPRWTLLIAPDHVPSKDLLDSCSIDTSKLLVIRQKHITDMLSAVANALGNGNFAAVVVWSNIINSATIGELQQYTDLTNTQLIAFSDLN